MWLTGFDAPCLHTMYVDKPMRGHGLMQAIARVNRVFRDKPGGLVVDYLGLADQLQAGAGHLHRERRPGRDRHRPGGGRRGHAGEVRGLLRHLPRLRLVALWTTGTPAAAARPASRRRRSTSSPRRTARTRLLAGGDRAVARRSRSPCRTTRRSRIRDDVGFFQAVRAALVKTSAGDGEGRRGARPRHPADRLARPSPPTEVIDIFAAAGLKKPDISILSDEFLAEVAGPAAEEPGRRAAAQAPRATRSRPARSTNLVQSRSFAEMLETGHPRVPEPRHRDRAGHRGADRAGQGDARGRRSAARSWA